ncbi:MAG: CAP domain-containing protein [Oscillospiraceae bacterium]|jgi:uncharacterized protein YkwD|nr:CAP domain-containing protein [Oscillospiraceae bacterium]
MLVRKVDKKRRTAAGGAALWLLCTMFGLFLCTRGAVALPTVIEPRPETRHLETELIDSVNGLRAERNLPALRENASLTEVAREKAEQIRRDDEFAHILPSYGDPFSMMERAGLKFTAAGEDLAHAHYSAATTVVDWMNSLGHRNNVLSPVFDEIGVGLAPDRHGGWIWVALFMKSDGVVVA